MYKFHILFKSEALYTSLFRVPGPNHDVVAFFPATEDGWLVNGVKKILREEGQRNGFNIKVVEKSGTPLS